MFILSLGISIKRNYIFSKECNVLPCINPINVKPTLFNISIYAHVT